MTLGAGLVYQGLPGIEILQGRVPVFTPGFIGLRVNKTINFLKQRKNRAHMSLNDLDFKRRA